MTRWPRLHLVLALAAALVLLVIATSTRPPKPTPTQTARYVTARGQQLRYVRDGRGPTVVLIHGYGESLIAWRGVFDLLAQDADVIALDLPGFGLSSKPARGYATDSIAATVLAALQTLGVGRAVLVGHSLGGAVSSAAALAAPDRIRALVLLDPAVVGAPLAVPEGRPGDFSVDAARRAVARYEAMRTRFTPPHDPQWLEESASALAYLPAQDSAYAASAAAVLAEFDFGYLTPERVLRLQQPTLVVWGEYDPVLPLSAGRALAASLPHAEFRVVERSWHRPHEERPAETAQIVRQFLLEHPE